MNTNKLIIPIVFVAVACGSEQANNPAAEFCFDHARAFCQKAVDCGISSSSVDDCTTSFVRAAGCAQTTVETVCDGREFFENVAFECVFGVELLGCETFSDYKWYLEHDYSPPNPVACGRFCGESDGN